jgi:hypothetical protein
VNVTYIARRSVIAGHTAGLQYTAAFRVATNIRQREAVKSVQRSLSGITETLYLRADKNWRVSFSPVAGADLLALTEFLDSTEAGEAFQMTLNGDANPTVTVKRIDNGYTRDLAVEVGSPTTDYFSASIEVVES